jgi:hypothetical protein
VCKFSERKGRVGFKVRLADTHLKVVNVN